MDLQVSQPIPQESAAPPAGGGAARLGSALQRRASLLATVIALGASLAVCLLGLRFFFEPREPLRTQGVSTAARQLAKRHTALWADPELRQGQLDRMRSTNAEWDFMGRSFLVWSLANLSLRDPSTQAENLVVMDRIIDETLKLERERGMFHFLMPYAQRGDFVTAPARSQFLDGEIALMLGLRRMVAEKAEYRAPLEQRVRVMAERMGKSPVLSAESYPNECWTFCNTIALAAMRVADHLDGSDHSRLLRRWVATAKNNLVDPETGLLVSSYTVDGKVLDGPEGSSIWMSAHALQIINAEFAGDQYRRARAELGKEFVGFGYASEWPASWQNGADVDSGPVIPVLDASAGSSGLAFVGAAAFDDQRYYQSLSRAILLGGFPLREQDTLRFAAGNQVGDAVLLYSTLLGPAWDRINAGSDR